MTVWVVSAGFNYESGLFLDVFAKKEDADKKADFLRDDGFYEWVDVDEMAVN